MLVYIASCVKGELLVFDFTFTTNAILEKVSTPLTSWAP